MYYAIHTKFLPPTDHRGARIKASLDRCTVVVPYPYDLNPDAAHRHAAERVIQRWKTIHPDWSRIPRSVASGELPDGTFAHVFYFVDSTTV